MACGLRLVTRDHVISMFTDMTMSRKDKKQRTISAVNVKVPIVPIRMSSAGSVKARVDDLTLFGIRC